MFRVDNPSMQEQVQDQRPDNAPNGIDGLIGEWGFYSNRASLMI